MQNIVLFFKYTTDPHYQKGESLHVKTASEIGNVSQVVREITTLSYIFY